MGCKGIRMKIVFMGTPMFAVESLKALHEKYEVVMVVTQPDTLQGRKQILTPPTIKVEAEKLGIPIQQPNKITDKNMVSLLQTVKADVFVVAAYGQILSKEILEIPTFGCLNIHASLLPRWRGAGPIQRAIMAGDDKTGITIMKMDEGLDTGDMLYKMETDILPTDTAGSLHDRLALLGSEAIVYAIENLNMLLPVKQDDSLATYASMLDKNSGSICWDSKAQEVDFLVRGVNPWPGAFTCERDSKNKFKVWAGKVIPLVHDKNPGEILECSEKGILVACGKDAYLITEIQRIGGKRMDMHAFLCGSDMSGKCFQEEEYM